MITSTTKVAEIAAESLAAIRVFQKHGIDFCCGGQRPIADVCGSKAIPVDTLINELNAAIAGPASHDADWNTATLRDLMAYIVDRHHTYLRNELPRIQTWLDKVHSKYAEQDPASIGMLPPVFNALRAELESHLEKEEVILFPWIARYEAALESGEGPIRLPFGRFDNPMNCMEAEHESAGDALRRLRSLTNDYTPPDHACRTYRALYEALAELEADLHMHIHLENNLLHPRARQLASETEAVGVAQ